MAKYKTLSCCQYCIKMQRIFLMRRRGGGARRAAPRPVKIPKNKKAESKKMDSAFIFRFDFI